MKLLLFLFVHILSAAKLSYSPILKHFLCSNGYVSSPNDLGSIMQAPFSHLVDSPLFLIMIKAMRNTRLVLASNDKYRLYSNYSSNSVERNCFRDVLEMCNSLQQHRILLQHTYNLAECNVDEYFLVLHWTGKDLEFMLSMKPSKDMALNTVLQSLNVKVSRMADEYQKMLHKVLTYPTLVMNAYSEYDLPSHSAPPLDVEWAKANVSAEPKVLYSLFSQLLQHNIISAHFLTSVQETFSSSYRKFIKSKGNDIVAYGFNGKLFQPAFATQSDLYHSISNGWLAFWLQAMGIRRTLPSPSGTALGPSLIESFNIEIKNMDEVVNQNEKTLKYFLNCSCLHVNYLIACMQLALVFDLLNHQDHVSCVNLILAHRELALKMIYNLSRKA